MSEVSRAGNRRRCNRWRQKNREKYNAYLRKWRAEQREAESEGGGVAADSERSRDGESSGTTSSAA